MSVSSNGLTATELRRGELPRRYESLEAAFERMQGENRHLSADQARYLTVHGSNQNEDGSYSWKFDNYTHVMAPFDLNLEQTRALWSRIDAPLLLVSGSESEFAKHKVGNRLSTFRTPSRSCSRTLGIGFIMIS